jgi:hypothetical protein
MKGKCWGVQAERKNSGEEGTKHKSCACTAITRLASVLSISCSDKHLASLVRNECPCYPKTDTGRQILLQLVTTKSDENSIGRLSGRANALTPTGAMVQNTQNSHN